MGPVMGQLTDAANRGLQTMPTELAIREMTGCHTRGRADPRIVLIHGQMPREDQVDALRELGIFPSLFPMHTSTGATSTVIPCWGRSGRRTSRRPAGC